MDRAPLALHNAVLLQLYGRVEVLKDCLLRLSAATADVLENDAADTPEYKRLLHHSVLSISTTAPPLPPQLGLQQLSSQPEVQMRSLRRPCSLGSCLQCCKLRA